VCERRVDLLVCSLPLHRHSYIGFILAFASSIHNKQKYVKGRLHSAFVRLLFLQAHRETDRFFAASGVQPAHAQRDMFNFRRTVLAQQIKGKVGLTLVKVAALRINLNLDGVPITSKSHTHPSHSQTSRLLTSSLSVFHYTDTHI
jgi:hypothetical protein